MKPSVPYQTAAGLIPDWRADLERRAPRLLWQAATSGPLAKLEMGPGLITLIGGAPGEGKTALATQLIVDALRLNPSLKAIIANVEMPPYALLDRQLARLSGIDLTTIRHRTFGDEHDERLTRAFCTMESFADRLAFLRPPFSVSNLGESGDNFGAGLLLVDYIQRLLPPKNYTDKRSSINAAMDHVRQFADAGVGVVLVSAVGRVKDSRGQSSYAGESLNLGSFRESSELEYGADDAFLLVRGPGSGIVTLRHLKARHAEPTDLQLAFDGRLQRFASAPNSSKSDESGDWKKRAPHSSTLKVVSPIADEIDLNGPETRGDGVA